VLEADAEDDAEDNAVPQFHVGLTGTTARISVPNHEHIAGYRYVRLMQAYAARVRPLPAHQLLLQIDGSMSLGLDQAAVQRGQRCHAPRGLVGYESCALRHSRGPAILM
jgi:hypothetical protein